jgi:hypothetical protein
VKEKLRIVVLGNVYQVQYYWNGFFGFGRGWYPSILYAEGPEAANFSSKEDAISFVEHLAVRYSEEVVWTNAK